MDNKTIKLAVTAFDEDNKELKTHFIDLDIHEVQKILKNYTLEQIADESNNLIQIISKEELAQLIVLMFKNER